MHDSCIGCPTCQDNKASLRKPGGPFQSPPLLKQQWTSISMGFVVQLPKLAKSHDAMFVVVGRLGKMAYFIPSRTSSWKAC